MKKLLSAVLSTLLFLTVPMVTRANQEVDTLKMSKDHKAAYDASLALYGNLEDESHFLCTATVVAQRETHPGGEAGIKKNEYLLLTAGHCITGEGLPEDLKFFVRTDIIPEAGSEHAAGSIPAKVVRAENSSAYDFAILYITADEDFKPIEIDFINLPEIEQSVYSVNFSEGLVKQVALGKVASQPITGKNPDENGRFMVHLFAGHGASGAAVISEKNHKIVGIVEFGFDGSTLGSGCESMLKLKEWLSTPTPSSKLSPKADGPQFKVAKW